MIPMHSVDGAWKVAAALCSRHIGGAINYVAVCDVLATPAATVTAGKREGAPLHFSTAACHGRSLLSVFTRGMLPHENLFHY
jgi:hypothetical protein